MAPDIVQRKIKISNKKCILNKFGLYDCEPDEDGLFEGMIVPEPVAKYILYLSSLSFASGLYGLYKGYYLLASIPILVGCTTILYWHKPTDGWRRYLDMFISMTGFAIYLFLAFGAQYAIPFYIFNMLAMACYPIGHYYHNQGYTWLGTIWHSGIHILANISIVILFLGTI